MVGIFKYFSTYSLFSYFGYVRVVITVHLNHKKKLLN